MSNFSLNQAILLMAVISAVAAITPFLAKWLRLPSLVIFIIAGAILGSNGLGVIERGAELITLEQVGLQFIMLQAGLQMNLSQFRSMGMKALIFGLLTFAIPFGVGAATGYWLLGTTIIGTLLMGLMYSPHALVSYPIATQLGIQHREVVNVAAGGTAVTLVLTLGSYAIIRGLQIGTFGMMMVLKLFVLLPGLVALAWFIVPNLAQRFISKNNPALTSQLTFTFACTFGVALATDWLGVDAIVGSFLAGLALNRAIENDSSLMGAIEQLGNAIFIPAFLISVGVLCDGKLLFSDGEIALTALLIAVGAMLAKAIAAILAGRVSSSNYSAGEYMVLSGLTMSRAPLILVIGLFALKVESITEMMFSALILYVAITILIGPFVTEAGGKRMIDYFSPA